jgi:hypothetical protein
MNAQIQNDVYDLRVSAYPFDTEIDQKLDDLRPKFEHTLRELIRLCMDWSGGVPPMGHSCREEREAP